MTQLILACGLLTALVGLIWLFLLDILNDLLGNDPHSLDGFKSRVTHPDSQPSQHDKGA
jgi:hypothetical protein